MLEPVEMSQVKNILGKTVISDKGATTYSVGTDANLSMFGHLSSTTMSSAEDRQVYISTPVTDDGGNGSAYMPDYEAKALRMITQGNATDRSGVNMLTKNQASVETDTTGFTAITGATISKDTVEKYIEGASLKVVTTASVGSGVDFASVPVLAGTNYSFNCRIKGTGTIAVKLFAMDAGGSAVGSKYTSSVVNMSTWSLVKVENFTVPATTTSIVISIAFYTAVASTFYYDAGQLERGSTSTEYSLPGDAPLSIGNYNIQWTGRKYSYNVVPSVNYVLSRLHYRLGSTMVMDANSVINVRGYKGTSEAGIKIVDRTISASTSPYSIIPNGEVYIDAPNLDYREGEEFHYVLEMLDSDQSHQFSLMTNEDNAQPWRAVDGQRFEMRAMIPSNAIYPDLLITSPTAGQSGLETNPTISTVKGISKNMNWHGGFDQVVSSNASVFQQMMSLDIPANALGDNGIIKGSIMLDKVNGSASNVNVIMQYGEVDLVGSLEAPVGMSNIYFQLSSVPNNNQFSYLTVNYAGYSRAKHVVDLSQASNIKVSIVGGTASDQFVLRSYDFALTNNDIEQSSSYEVGSTEIKIKEAATQVTAFQSSTVGLSGTVTDEKRLKGSTLYNAYARHKTSSGIVLPWSKAVNFKTLMDVNIIFSNGIVAGDLVEINVGESATATGYNFHVSGLSDKFPPAAFDSGEFRFRDTDATLLPFKLQSVTGTAPNRTAKIYIEASATFVSNDIIQLIGVGASASNASQAESAWKIPWTPTNLTGSYRWWDAADISQELSTAVPSWTSKGTITTFAEANVANQPYVKSTLVNSNKMLHFGGADDGLTTTINHLGSTDHSIYMVWEPKATNENHDLFGYWENGAGSVLIMDMTSAGADTGIRAHVYNSSNTATSPALSKPSIIGQRYERNNARVYASHNGVQATGTLVASVYSGGGTKTYGLGGKTRPSGVEYANGYIGDVVIATYDMGDPSLNTDAGKLTGYLAHKFASTVDLAVGHPYKTIAPTVLGKTIHTDKFISI